MLTNRLILSLGMRIKELLTDFNTEYHHSIWGWRAYFHMNWFAGLTYLFQLIVFLH